MNDQSIFIEGIEVVTLETLYSRAKPINWLIPNYLHSGSIGLMVAPPKSFKTTMALHMTHQLSIGGEFLGNPCAKSKVLCICLEGGEDSIAETAKNMKISSSDEIYLVFKRPTGERNPVDLLRAMISTLDPQVIFIDCLMKWHPFGEKDYLKASSIMGAYSDLAREKDVSIIFLHHSPKNAENSSDGVMGSVGIWGGVDFKYLLYPQGKITNFKNDQRNARGKTVTPLIINREEGTVTIASSPTDDKVTEMRHAFFNIIVNADPFVKDRDLKAAVRGNDALKVRAIQSLLQNGAIEKIQLDGKGTPIAYKSLWQIDEFESYERAISVEQLPLLFVDTNSVLKCAATVAGSENENA